MLPRRVCVCVYFVCGRIVYIVYIPVPCSPCMRHPLNARMLQPSLYFWPGRTCRVRRHGSERWHKKNEGQELTHAPAIFPCHAQIVHERSAEVFEWDDEDSIIPGGEDTVSSSSTREESKGSEEAICSEMRSKRQRMAAYCTHFSMASRMSATIFCLWSVPLASVLVRATAMQGECEASTPWTGFFICRMYLSFRVSNVASFKSAKSMMVLEMSIKNNLNTYAIYRIILRRAYGWIGRTQLLRYAIFTSSVWWIFDRSQSQLMVCSCSWSW